MKKINTFLRYVLLIAFVLTVVSLKATTFAAVGSNVDEGSNLVATAPTGGGSNADEGVNTAPTGGGSNTNEGVNTAPTGGGSNTNEGGSTPASGGSNADESNTTLVGGGSNTNEGGNTTTTPSGGGNTGGGGCINCGGGGGRGTVIQISNIKISLFGFTIPTTNLIVGQTYTISWSASIRNVNTILSLVPISSGSNISIGPSLNPNAINLLNWTVPKSVIPGNYILRFTDPNNQVTNAPAVYKILAKSASPVNYNGIGGGNLPLTGGQTSTTPLSGVTEENSSSTPLAITQTASVGNTFANFWGSRYVLWFFILLLIIAIILLVRERRNLNESKNKISNPAPIIKPIKPTPISTPTSASVPKPTPISTSTSNPTPKKYN